MRQYQTAVRAMEADIAKWYQRFADANGITLAEAGRLLNSDELLEFQWTVEDYIQSGRENAVSGVWMKELESASARVHISRLDSLKMSLRQHVEELIGMQLKALPEVLHATYRESYDRTVYELSRGSRVMLSYQKPDVRRIDRVLGTPWSSDGKEFSERVWENRAQLIGSMNTHLTQSIIRGEDPQKAINAIAKDMDVSKRRAGTLVMTESAAIATAAQRDCYKDLDVEEFEYVCTLDEVTCPVCGAMDGKHFPMSKYEIGVNVPPMHPNCRCATAPYFDDMDDWGAERAARDENGKTVSVPAEMTYEQWKKEQKKADNAPVDKQLTGKSVPEKYQKRAESSNNSENEVDNSGESGIIRARGDSDYYVAYPESFSPKNEYEGSSRLSSDLRARLSSFEDEVRDSDIEMAIIITSSGEIMRKTTGAENSVEFSYLEMREMKGGVLSHNHSNGTTFSSNDISMLFYTGLSEIRACNSDGAYVMRLPQFPRPRYRSKQEIEDILRSYEKKYSEDRARGPSRPLKVRDYESQQYAVEQFAKLFHCDYYFERRQ